MRWESFEREGTHLAYCDFGGSGLPLLLLHGLAGHAREWAQSVDLLRDHYRVFGVDQRGHGDSTRRPVDLSREAFVEDCAAVIRQIGLGPFTLVGQSMGASTALLTAAAHPELVRSLVIIEGSPDGPEEFDPDPEGARQIGRWLNAWPVPFPDTAAARGFFEGSGLQPDAWTAGLEQRPDGLWPRWDATALVQCMADLLSRNYWPQWRSITAPTLIVFGEHGRFSTEHGNHLVNQSPASSVVIIGGAGHDVHLDAPDAWVKTLKRSTAR
jgi:pimeloyl-ACP methyl ester carboxylesterase